MAQVNRLFLRSLRLEAGLKVRFNHRTFAQFMLWLSTVNCEGFSLLNIVEFIPLDPFHQRDEERSGGGGRRRPNLADPRRGA